jgi:putative endonuclease
MKYWTYIVCSPSGTLYIGVTNNIGRRMWEHKSSCYEGFASRYGCNRLVYHESYDSAEHAIGRQKQLKGWVRRKKLALIESINPRWEDLAGKWGAQMAFEGESISNKDKLSS